MNSEHEILSTEDMDDVVKAMDAMLMTGGQGVLFCSSLQLRDWYDAFTQYRANGEPCTKTVRHTKRRRKGQVVMAEESALIFVKRNGTLSARGQTSFGHMNVYEEAIHVWNPNERVSDQTRVDYKPQGFINDTYPRYGNLMT